MEDKDWIFGFVVGLIFGVIMVTTIMYSDAKDFNLVKQSKIVNIKDVYVSYSAIRRITK